MVNPSDAEGKCRRKYPKGENCLRFSSNDRVYLHETVSTLRAIFCRTKGSITKALPSSWKLCWETIWMCQRKGILHVSKVWRLQWMRNTNVGSFSTAKLSLTISITHDEAMRERFRMKEHTQRIQDSRTRPTPNLTQDIVSVQFVPDHISFNQWSQLITIAAEAKHKTRNGYHTPAMSDVPLNCQVQLHEVLVRTWGKCTQWISRHDRRILWELYHALSARKVRTCFSSTNSLPL